MSAVVVERAGAGEILDPALDARCATGENALVLAARGPKVLRADVVPAALASGGRYVVLRFSERERRAGRAAGNLGPCCEGRRIARRGVAAP